METCLNASHLIKRFPLSKKQAKERNTSSRFLTAVDDVSFQVGRGEIYALLGPNGAGKTTCLRMIAGLISPTSGTIEIDGKTLTKSTDSLRGRIGFLTSELKLDPFFTPNYTYAFLSTLYGIEEEAMKKKRDALFARFGIDKFAETRISELSTGMKQKCSLAMSIAGDPELIVYDEPTNGLDIVASRAVEDFLADEKAAGRAIVISTHIFSLVEKLADRVGFLIDGKMALEGIKAEIASSHGSIEEAFFDVYGGEK